MLRNVPDKLAADVNLAAILDGRKILSSGSEHRGLAPRLGFQNSYLRLLCCFRPPCQQRLVATAGAVENGCRRLGPQSETSPRPRPPWTVLQALNPQAMTSRSKKACGQPSNTAPTWRERGNAGFVSKAILIRRDWSLSMRPRSPSIMVRLRGRCPRGERLISHVPQ